MRGKTKHIVILAIVGALATAAVAFAYWTQGGTGSGTASTGSTTPITVNQTSTVSGLYPGGPAVTLSGNFDNPNAQPVHLSSVTATVHAFTSHAVDGAKPDCTAADFAIGGSTGPIVVPNGTGVGSWTGLTVRLVDGAGNQDNCKNVTITLDYTANP